MALRDWMAYSFFQLNAGEKNLSPQCLPLDDPGTLRLLVESSMHYVRVTGPVSDSRTAEIITKEMCLGGSMSTCRLPVQFVPFLRLYDVTLTLFAPHWLSIKF